jgi:hypothetical protein
MARRKALSPGRAAAFDCVSELVERGHTAALGRGPRESPPAHRHESTGVNQAGRAHRMCGPGTDVAKLEIRRTPPSRSIIPA